MITVLSPASSAMLYKCQTENPPGCFSFPSHSVLLFTPFILILVSYAVLSFFFNTNQPEDPMRISVSPFSRKT